MAKTWYATDCNIFTNPKTLALATALKLDVDTVVGKLGRLWSWAMMSRSEDGDTSHLPAAEIADIMRWKKKPDVLIDALVECGFLEKDGGYIHDWMDMNGKFVVKRRRDNERLTTLNSTGNRA